MMLNKGDEKKKNKRKRNQIKVLCFEKEIVGLDNQSKRKKRKKSSLTSLQSGSLAGTGVSPGITTISVDKSVEFTLYELAKATDKFQTVFKIRQGGFGDVYYAELRGEKAAIKKMDMEETKQF